MKVVSVYSDVLVAIAPLFVLILFGYVAKKTRLLNFTDAPVLNRFVISISLPAFVLHALITNRLKANLIQLPFVFWLAEGIIFLLAVGAAKLLKWSPAATGTLALQSIFGNTGYIGYPMCTALLPMRLPGAVIIDQLGMSVPLYPGAPILGSVFGTSEGDRMARRPFAFLLTPAFLALGLGILLRLIPTAWLPTSPPMIELGKILLQLIGLVGAVTIPVVLIAVGLILKPSSLAAHGSKVVVVGLFKLILMPIIVWLIARHLFHITGTFLAVCVMQASMPPSATATLFAGQYDMDSNLAIASFFALTVISAVTLPLMLGLLR